MTTTSLMKQAEKMLKDTFGFTSFRPIQKEVIQAVFQKKDTFVLLPTGGGKSLCYQIPALTLPGTTIVVSPLISLMKDQVDTLRANGIAAAFINSSQSSSEQATVLSALTNKKIKILYVSPEKITTSTFLAKLSTHTIPLFAIDEAHCISSWGHDFRPDYSKLSKLKHFFPSTPIMALTATADVTTQRDILSQLEIHTALLFKTSFDRPNISLRVLPAQNRFKKIIRFLNTRFSQPGIIYCLTRNQTESLTKKLQQHGFTAASYHAGLSSSDRSRIQKSFIRDKTNIICATVAFGMGIDKSNIRWIIHYNLPKSIEHYYQEIGRAGRDGQPADTILFYTYADVERIQSFAIDRSRGTVQLAKLERMKELAESVTCRRQALLSYFGEYYPKACKACDLCNNPIQHTSSDVTGTDILWTLSHLSKKNSHHTVPTKKLISELIETHGGTTTLWKFALAQLKNRNLVTTHYDANASLSLTNLGSEFIEKKTEVKLVPLFSYLEHIEKLR